MKVPKRRKSKDNPYTLNYDQKNNIYTVSFTNVKGRVCCIEVDYSLYRVFDEFELLDLSQLNEFDRHIEHLNVIENDEILFRKSLKQEISPEELAEKNIQSEIIKEAIKDLPEVQKRRLRKYYFEDKTYEEIALEENCTKRAVKFSVDIAIEKISKKFQK